MSYRLGVIRRFYPRAREGRDLLTNQLKAGGAGVSIRAPVKDATIDYAYGAYNELVSIRAPVKDATCSPIN